MASAIARDTRSAAKEKTMSARTKKSQGMPWLSDHKRLCICGIPLTQPRQRRCAACKRKNAIARQQQYRQKNAGSPTYMRKQRENSLRSYRKNPERARKLLRDRARERHARDRQAAIEAYGSNCYCYSKIFWLNSGLPWQNGQGERPLFRPATSGEMDTILPVHHTLTILTASQNWRLSTAQSQRGCTPMGISAGMSSANHRRTK